MTTMRWGVLGARSMIFRQAIAPAIEASEGRHVVQRAASQGAYERVLDDPAVDAVYLPLPNGLHREWAERAAAAGKHVLCEKPLGRNAAEAEAIIAACASAGVVLMEAYMTPHHPRSAEVVRLAASGELGELLFGHLGFTFPHPNPRDHRFDPVLGGGALLDVGIYTVAPLLAITGQEPEHIDASARTTDRGVDVSISARLRFPGGFAATIECSFEAPDRQTLELVGTRGDLRAGTAFTPGLADDSFVVTDREGRTVTHRPGGGPLYLLMLDRFAAVVRGEASPVHTLEDTVRVARTLDRIRQAAGLPLVGA